MVSVNNVPETGNLWFSSACFCESEKQSALRNAEDMIDFSLGLQLSPNSQILFVFFFVFQEKIKFPIFLSQWPFSLFVAKTCLSDRIFPEFFFACGGLTKFEKTCHSDRIFAEKFFACGRLINLRVTFGNSFFTQKTLSNTLLSSVFQTAFWVKKEFPNVTHKLISSPQAKNFCVKIRSLRQVFATKRENGHWDRKIGCLFTKKNGKIIVSVTVNSGAPLQKNVSVTHIWGNEIKN